MGKSLHENLQLWALFCMLLFGTGIARGDDRIVVFNFSSQSDISAMGYNYSKWSATSVSNPTTRDTVTFTPEQGLSIKGSGYTMVKYSLNLQERAAFSLSVPLNFRITQVVFGNMTPGLLSADNGSMNEAGDTWTGEERSVRFSNGEGVSGSLKTITVTVTEKDDVSGDEAVVGEKFVADSIQYEVTGIGDRNKVDVIGSVEGLRFLQLRQSVDYKNKTFIVSNVRGGAFAADTILTSIEIPTTVNIGNGGFQGCTALNSVAFVQPTGQTDKISLGHNAFYGCSALHSIDLALVDSMGGGSFAESGLDSVFVPSGIKHLGDSLFFNCPSLAIAELEEGISEVAASMFWNDTQLNRVVLPKTVTTIGHYAFAKCRSLTNIELPDGVSTLSENMLWGCTGLTEITLPSHCSTIESAALADCSGLGKVVMGKNLTQIDNYAFSGSDALDSVFVGAVNPPSSGAVNVFDNSVYSSAVLVVPTESKDSYRGSEYVWSHFESIRGKDEIGLDVGSKFTVEGIKYRITNMNPPLVEVAGCEEGTTAAEIHSSVAYLDRVWTVSAIGEAAFANNQELSSVVVSSQIPEIKNNAFYGAAQLASFAFSNNKGDTPVNTLGASAFEGCASLRSFAIPSTVRNIGDDCFNGCGLVEISYPATIQHMGERVNYHCKDLQKATFEQGTTVVPARMFWGCEKLAEASLPSTVDSLGMYAFAECSSLKSIDIPAAVKELPYSLFWGSHGLEGIRLHEGLEKIGDAVFTDCSRLKFVELPSTLQSMGYMAFVDCDSIDTVRVNATTPPSAGDDCFSQGVYGKAKLLVPAGQRNIYRLTESCWCLFDKDNIIEMTPTGIAAPRHEEMEDQRCYSISGLSVSSTAKGLIIVKGHDGRIHKTIRR